MTLRTVSLVTGAASGIGRRLVRRLLDRGQFVIATDLNMEGLRSAAEEDGWSDAVTLRQLDVRRNDQWRDVIDFVTQQLERLDLLFNVAGYLRPARTPSFTEDDVHMHFDVNVKGVVFGTRAAARAMVAQGHGHIVNIASLAGVAPIPGLTLYSASKFAVRGFSLAAAQDLKPNGIYVTAVCPDAVQTPMLDLQVDYEEAALTFSGDRTLTVDDVCDAVLGPVLNKRPVEFLLPMHRGALAKIANVAPAVAAGLDPLLRSKGAKAQKSRRG